MDFLLCHKTDADITVLANLLIQGCSRDFKVINSAWTQKKIHLMLTINTEGHTHVLQCFGLF